MSLVRTRYMLHVTRVCACAGSRAQRGASFLLAFEGCLSQNLRFHPSSNRRHLHVEKRQTRNIPSRNLFHQQQATDDSNHNLMYLCPLRYDYSVQD